MPLKAPPPPLPRWQHWRVDVPAAIASPPEPTRWAVEPLVARGTVTTLAAKTSVGKTWIMYDAADAVARGSVTAAGLRGEPGKALIVDAEMGRPLAIDRWRAQGYSDAVSLYAGVSIDVTKPEGQQDLAAIIAHERPTFVGIDSLRRIALSARENDSDSMAVVLGFLAHLAREYDCAVLVLHHDGHDGSGSRGSIAIMDQSDAVWHMTKAHADAAEGSPESEVRRLTCQDSRGKAPRYTRPPAAFHVRIPQATGGVVATEGPAPKRTADDYAQAIPGVLPQPTKAALAKAIGAKRNNSAFEAAVADLLTEGAMHVNGNGFELGPGEAPEL